MSLRRRTLLAAGAGTLVLPLRAHAAVQRVQARLFGGPVELLLPARVPAAVVAPVLRGLAAIDRRWNAWKPGELRSLNEALQAGRTVRAALDLVALLRRAAAFEVASSGAYNAALGGVVGTWGFHADRLVDGPAPATATVQTWQRARPSLAQLEMRGDTLRSLSPALQIDLGGCAKGAAADWALAQFAAAGVHDALVNLGGNLAARGDAGGRPWQVGLRDPFGPGLAVRLEVDGAEAIVTSGVYERWRVAGGQRIAHVLDPATAAPLQPGLASVTVVHRDATLADAAATALLVAGPEAWMARARRLGVAQVAAIDHVGRLHATPALAPRLRPA